MYVIEHIRVSLWNRHIYIGKRLGHLEFSQEIYFSAFIFLALENDKLMIKNGGYLSAFLGVDTAAVVFLVSPSSLAVATFLPI